MLAARRDANAVAFVASFVAGLVATIAVVLLTGWQIPDTSGGGVVQIVVGAGCLGVALGQWWARRRHGDAVAVPGWMDALERQSIGRAATLGTVLAVPNPKTVALTVTMAAGIAGAGLAPGLEVAALTIFVLVAVLPMLVAMLLGWIGGSGAHAALDRLRRWLIAHGHVVILAVFGLIGVEMIVVGVSGVVG